MIFIETVKELAISLAETTDEPHFDKIALNIRKKIFPTYDAKWQTVSIKLSEIDQNVFCTL